MTLGETSRQPHLFKSTAYVAERVPGNSIWTLLAREGERLFPDEMFADLFAARGRRSVPPSRLSVGQTPALKSPRGQL